MPENAIFTVTFDLIMHLLTFVRLDEAGVRWTFIPRQLPTHPTY